MHNLQLLARMDHLELRLAGDLSSEGELTLGNQLELPSLARYRVDKLDASSVAGLLDQLQLLSVAANLGDQLEPTLHPLNHQVAIRGSNGCGRGGGCLVRSQGNTHHLPSLGHLN